MNEEALKKLVEQMPRVENYWIKGQPCLCDPHEVHERATQAQQKADAEWVVEQGLVHLPSEEEIAEQLHTLNLVSRYAAQFHIRAMSQTLLRWLRERG